MDSNNADAYLCAGNANMSFEKYDEAIKANKIEIEDLIELEEIAITEKEIDVILNKLMEEA